MPVARKVWLPIHVEQRLAGIGRIQTGFAHGAQVVRVPRILAVPELAEVAQAGQQAPPCGGVVDGQVPPGLRQSLFQRIDAEFIDGGVSFDVFDRRVRVVEDRAERRGPDRQGRNQVDALGRRRKVVQEEPEHREILRLGNPFREQRLRDRIGIIGLGGTGSYILGANRSVHVSGNVQSSTHRRQQALKRRESPKRFKEIGENIRAALKYAIDDVGIAGDVPGLFNAPSLNLELPDESLRPKVNTLFIQEMAKRGVHTSGRFMATLAHTDEDIRITAEAARESLQIIRGELAGELDELLEAAEKREAIQRIVR